MHIPWDKKYLKISFHVIITVLAVFSAGLLIKNIVPAVKMCTSLVNGFLIVMRPLLAAFVFAFLAEAPIQLLSRFFKPKKDGCFYSRSKAVAAFYLILAFLVFLCARGIALKIGSFDINAISGGIASYIREFSDILVLLQVKLVELGILKNVEGWLNETIVSLTLSAENFVSELASSAGRAGGIVLDALIGLVIAFYISSDKEKLFGYCSEITDVFLPESSSRRVKRIAEDVSSVFSGYLRGQLTDAFIMAVLISSSFYVAGIKYPVIIGLISGFSNLIPYLGAITAFLLSTGVAFLSGNPAKAVYAAVIVVLLQEVDAVLIVPRVVGKSVKLHPALIIISLSVFGSLFGLWGMVFAVPFTALFKIFLTRLYHDKKNSRFQTF